MESRLAIHHGSLVLFILTLLTFNKQNALIQDQGYEELNKGGKDNWIGGHSFINKGVSTGMGVVVGAGTVTKKTSLIMQLL